MLILPIANSVDLDKIYKLSDFEIIEKVNISNNHYIKYKAIISNKQYIIKSYNKQYIINNKLEDFINNEIKFLYADNFLFMNNLITHFEDDNFIYLVHKFYDTTFKDLLIKNNISEIEKYNIIMQLLITVKKIHDNGKIIKLLNPDTIYVTDDNSILLDYIFLPELENNNKLYNSPEQLTSNIIKPESNIFTLGIIYYEIICYTTPFKTESDIKNINFQFTHNFNIFNKDLLKKIFIINPNERIKLENIFDHKNFLIKGITKNSYDNKINNYYKNKIILNLQFINNKDNHHLKFKNDELLNIVMSHNIISNNVSLSNPKSRDISLTNSCDKDADSKEYFTLENIKQEIKKGIKNIEYEETNSLKLLETIKVFKSKNQYFNNKLENIIAKIKEKTNLNEYQLNFLNYKYYTFLNSIYEKKIESLNNIKQKYLTINKSEKYNKIMNDIKLFNDNYEDNEDSESYYINFLESIVSNLFKI